MNFLINPNLAYLFVVAAVMLANTASCSPRSNLSKIGMLVCLAGAGFELFNLQANPWALMVVALCPFPFFVATRQSSQRRQLLLITAGMLVFGPAFLFVNKNGSPAINIGLLFLISVFCALFILVAAERNLNAQGARRGIDPDSLVGLTGTAITQVEDVGLVQIEGETCPARSEQPIPAGSTIRVVKSEGRVLIVKKMEKLNKE